MQPETVNCEFMLLIYSMSIIIYNMGTHVKKKSLQLILYIEASSKFIHFKKFYIMHFIFHKMPFILSFPVQIIWFWQTFRWNLNTKLLDTG